MNGLKLSLAFSRKMAARPGSRDRQSPRDTSNYFGGSLGGQTPKRPVPNGNALELVGFQEA